MGQPSVEVKRRYQVSERGRAARRAWYEANRDKAFSLERERQYRLNYGITIADYDRILAGQSGKCAICCAGTPTAKPKKEGERYRHVYFAVDHDHKTGRVRGLLCVSCNVALGRIEGWYARYKDSITAYLESPNA